MERVSNNLLALLLILAMLASLLGTTTALSRIESLKTPETGRLAGSISVCVSSLHFAIPIGDQNATQNEDYYLNVNDSTSCRGCEGFVRFYDNATFFDINETSGIINFSATNAMAGDYSVLILANESICGGEFSEAINFTIFNINDVPVLDFIPDQTLYEDSLFVYDVNATDPDLLTPMGDTLNFGDNTTMFEINITTGVISFIPVKSEVGNHSILIYVTDSGEPQYIDWQVVRFEIIAINHAPVLDYIGAQTAVEERLYYYDVNATDKDNDTLTFYDNTSLFNISPSTGVINFIPNISDKGNYSINISVTDGEKWDWEVVSFTVVGKNHPPNITYWYPNETVMDTAKELDNKTTSVWDYRGTPINFIVMAEDPDGTIPSFSWKQDNQTIKGRISDNYTFRSFTSGTYSIEVTATDGLLNDTHMWIVTILPRPVDPGPPPGPPTSPAEICFENWRCTEWSVCPQSGIQTRTCIDLNHCGTRFRKPAENRTCVYTPYPSCFDGIKNCHEGQCEIMADCGGPCKPCPTCDDNIRNQGEEAVDCGGPCPPCPEKCLQVITFAINIDTGECRAFPSPCDIPDGWKVVDECPPVQPVFILLYIIILAFLATVITLIWLQRKRIRMGIRNFFSRGKTVVMKKKKKKLTREEKLGKAALERIKKMERPESEEPEDEEEKESKSGSNE